jgi:hypothetical protein
MITTSTNQSISWFNKRRIEDSLRLAPPFQRKPVWTIKQKSLLIDTILRELPIPEIYIQRKTDLAGETEYIVVDGQQRIRSILEFIDGEFSIIAGEEDIESSSWEDSKFKDLDNETKQKFWDYNLAVRELPNVSDEEVRDIFRRLNVNLVPLNKQELRNARYNGPFITLMTKLADIEFWAENKIVTAAQIRRMTDIEYVSELFIAMMHGVQDGKNSLDDYYRQYEIELSEEKTWKNLFARTLITIQEMFPNLSLTRWKRKPDFYGLFSSLSHQLENYIISADKYEEIERLLIDFGKNVDKATELRERDKLPKNIREYFWAIEKATGNKDRRLKREEIITELINPFLVQKRQRLILRRKTAE